MVCQLASTFGRVVFSVRIVDIILAPTCREHRHQENEVQAKDDSMMRSLPSAKKTALPDERESGPVSAIRINWQPRAADSPIDNKVIRSLFSES
jgi:hypothetical protein